MFSWLDICNRSFALFCLTLKPTDFYNSEKHLKCTIILEVNYVCCAYITDFGLITYQRVLALLYMKQKLILLIYIKKMLYNEELVPYKATNFTSPDYPI